MRNQKIIKSGLEVELNFLVPEDYKEIFNNLDLNDFFICSKVKIGKNCFIGHGVTFVNDKFLKLYKRRIPLSFNRDLRVIFKKTN